MIVVKLLGGLGNQMFQYAFGLAIAEHTGHTVKYDTRELLDRSTNHGYTLREYELDVFKGEAAVATASEMQLFGPAPTNPLVGLPFKVYRRLIRPQWFRERYSFSYDPTMFKCGPNAYFEGYWQNERYFKPYEAKIRQALELKVPLSGRNLALAQQIDATPHAVALHIRRGDYVANAQANAAHGVCSPAYYDQAVQIMQAKVGNVRLFIFSDEPNWVQANMQFAVPTTLISHNTGKTSVEDLRLMSLCQHNIIANSSFSWWGAWLNPHPGKLVIAPKRWMQVSDIDSTDLIPATWLTI
jgi:hypothetical protein